MKSAIILLAVTWIIIAGAAAIILVNFSFFEPPQAQAQGGGGETPFGGMRTFSLKCTCSSPNELLYIQDYASNQQKKLLYVPGTSKIYDHQNPTGATYLLGTYSSSGSNSCRIRVGKKCITISKDGELGSQPGTGTSQ